MADLSEQMTSLLEKEELPYADDATAATSRIRGMPKSKKFFPKESINLLESYKPEIREQRQAETLDKNIEKMKSVGTGLLTGFAGLPSDVIEGVNFVNDFLAEQGSPKALLFKDAINEMRKNYGREAFDKKFTEITGIKSDGTNTAQIMGEILSPAGAFVATAKGVVKASEGATKLYKFLQDNFELQTKLLRGDVPPGTGGVAQVADGPTVSTATVSGQMSDLIDKNKDIISAGIDAAKVTKPIDSGDPNRPIINLSEIGLKTEAGQDAVKRYKIAEKNVFAARKQIYTRLNYYNLPNSVKDDLYRQTGVYRGKEGAFRFKISTEEAQLNVGGLSEAGIIEGGTNVVKRFNASKIPPEGISLEDVLNFQPLYKQYGKKENNFAQGIVGFEDKFPRHQYVLLKDIKVKSMDDLIKRRIAEGMPVEQAEKYKNTTSAVYSTRGDEEVIYVSSKDNLSKVRTDLLHEIQHAIQRREGYIGGDSPDGILKRMTNGNFNLDVKKLADDKAQILEDFIKDTPKLPMNDNMINIFKSATDKLIKREFKYMYKNMPDSKSAKDSLPNSAGTYKINVADDVNNVDSDGKAINFTPNEAYLINKIGDESSFIEYMKFRALLERTAIRLNKLEEKAIEKYKYSTGEMQARRTEKMDALYQDAIKELRNQGKLKPNELPTKELQDRIFRGIGVKDTGEYRDLFPSKFEGQGVLQDQKIKPQGTNVDTYAKIGEQ